MLKTAAQCSRHFLFLFRTVFTRLPLLVPTFIEPLVFFWSKTLFTVHMRLHVEFKKVKPNFEAHLCASNTHRS
ncbi:hypothetical protein AQUCO_03100052v1 [Aquilegia coerulea]|uniref:Uncharacterized protein n=1 Tax=Aquilegia coerulea TaxID=218851 RepID=A0A2G5D0H7_AQUCA|nr:hypothetical protein AQUCO_03100052v1 [Aquilegia coerulea]